MTEITFKSDMTVELIDSMGTDETVARAARVSTGKDQLEQGKIEGLIGYLLREGHTSCFEHCTVTIRAHVPIFVHRQLMTHRTLAKNSESGRYKELEPVFYVPAEDRPLVNAGSGAHPKLEPAKHPDTRDVVQAMHKEAAASSWHMYEYMISGDFEQDDVIATEVARNVLPVSTYTSLYMTGNLLAWFNFLRLRNGTNGHPQHEIVEVAQKVEAIIADLYPLSYKAWKATL